MWVSGSRSYSEKKLETCPKIVPAHQTSDMSRCTISPESHLKLEMVILSNLRFLAILTF